MTGGGGYLPAAAAEVASDVSEQSTKTTAKAVKE